LKVNGSRVWSAGWNSNPWTIGVAFSDPAGPAYSISIPVPSSRFAAKRSLLEKLLRKSQSELLAALRKSVM